MRYAELKPDLLASIFPQKPASRVADQLQNPSSYDNLSNQRSKTEGGGNINNFIEDEFSDDGLNDQDLLNAGKRV